MNFGGHAAVAAHVTPSSPRFWLGAALPDLSSMGRFRLLGTTTDPQISDGIAFHHKTDDAFHRHPWFTTRQADLYQRLLLRGLDRGPARAIAHVGPELLLDGTLAQLDPSPRDAMLAELTSLDVQANSDLTSLVEPTQQQAFGDHLRRIRSVGVPTDYHDPAAVGSRLQRVLLKRPRLSFEKARLAIVTEELHLTKREVDSAPQALIEELAADLS